jgi:thiazole/oxazole-forming peptide maturase SagC family component
VSPRQLAGEEEVPREDVERVIDQLLEVGALETEPTTALDHYLTHSLSWGAEGAGVSARPLLLLGDGDLVRQLEAMLIASLAGAGDVAVAGKEDASWAALSDDVAWLNDGLLFQERLELFEAWRGRLLVVAAASVDPVRLRSLNRVCLALDVPWLHTAIDGPFVLVGPLIVPRRSPCYECLETRVTMNLRQSASYVEYKRALAERHVRDGALPALPAVGGLLAGHAALESLNFALTGATFTVGKVLAIYLPTMEISFNELLRVPGCAACGPLHERDGTEPYFDAAALLNGSA